MATVEELEDTKYFPPLLNLGVKHRADTVVTTHVDGVAYFGAIADVLKTMDGPGDRLYITSWNLDPHPATVGGRIGPHRAAAVADGGGSGAACGSSSPCHASPSNQGQSAHFARLLANARSEARHCGRHAGQHRLGPQLGAATRGATAAAGKAGTGGLGRLQRLPAREVHDRLQRDHRRAARVLGGLDFRRIASPTNATSARPPSTGGMTGVSSCRAARRTRCWTTSGPAGSRPRPSRRDATGSAAVTELFNPPLSPRTTCSEAADITAAEVERRPGRIPTRESDQAQLRLASRRGGSARRRQLPWHTLPPTGVVEVSAGLVSAIDAAKRFIYVEDQTLNPSLPARVYNHHQVLFPVISAACATDVKVIFVTQGYPGPGALAPWFDATPDMSTEIHALILDDLTVAQRRNFAPVLPEGHEGSLEARARRRRVRLDRLGQSLGPLPGRDGIGGDRRCRASRWECHHSSQTCASSYGASTSAPRRPPRPTPSCATSG